MQNGRERLAEYRQRSHMNQKELARLLGVTDSYLSQLLSGRRKPGRETAVRIENLTGVQVESWSDTGDGNLSQRRTPRERMPRSDNELTAHGRS